MKITLFLLALALGALLAIAGCAQVRHTPPAKPAVISSNHPFQAADDVVLKVRRSAIVLSTIGLLVTGLAFGLYFTPLSYVSTFAFPIAGGATGLWLFGAIALPFAKFVLPAVALVLLLYELDHQGKLSGLESAAKAEVKKLWSEITSSTIVRDLVPGLPAGSAATPGTRSNPIEVQNTQAPATPGRPA